MKINQRHRVTVLFFGVIFLICTSIGVVSFAQNLEGFVIEGESLDNIAIGKSTMDEVIAFYGADYKLITHGKYSYEMIYRKLGLSFYSCQNDPNKEIFSIHIQAPFKATTGKGIVLNESTFDDVFRAYGKWEKNSMGFEYEKEGLYFDYEEETVEDSEETEETENQPNAVNSDEKTENTGFTIDGESGRENTFIIDGEEVTELRTGTLTNGYDAPFDIEQKEEGSSDSIEREESSDESETDKSEEKIIKAKIVKRIQLVEKNGLRQCDSKFPKK